MIDRSNAINLFPSPFESEFNKELEELLESKVLERLWQHDFTLWSSSPDEIANRLDWLHLHETMQSELPHIESFIQQIRDEQFEQAILLGMGGSSLAPEVFYKIFGRKAGYLDLRILDSTDPMEILKHESRLDQQKTIFIVATKSGGTMETLSLFKYFYNSLKKRSGITHIGSRFIAITDKGSNLETLGKQLQFREIFLNNPNLGGRYSALSYFGLLPAAMIGVDLKRLLFYAKAMAEENSLLINPLTSAAVSLGCLLGVAAQNGRDKLTFISDTAISSFSDWIEQLVAESTGKSGTGILPVVGEEIDHAFHHYGTDRLFILQELNTKSKLKNFSTKLREAGFPFAYLQWDNLYQIGGFILLWEMATAIAGHVMGIHPFNQPNVESAKVMANQSVQLFKEKGELPQVSTVQPDATSFIEFLSPIMPGDYINIQAYTTPTRKLEASFRALQTALRNKYNVAVTFGFGPRYLHSTGQLHKGDAGRGFFLQFVSSAKKDLDIPTKAGAPESFITFDNLKKAQAIGDAQALQQARRQVLTIFLHEPAGRIIDKLTKGIKYVG